jgi:hypothetical protein
MATAARPVAGVATAAVSRPAACATGAIGSAGSPAIERSSAKLAVTLLDEIGQPSRAGDGDIGPGPQGGHLPALRGAAEDRHYGQPHRLGQRRKNRLDPLMCSPRSGCGCHQPSPDHAWADHVATPGQ